MHWAGVRRTAAEDVTSRRYVACSLLHREARSLLHYESTRFAVIVREATRPRRYRSISARPLVALLSRSTNSSISAVGTRSSNRTRSS